nr:MAG TPA: hypothetical protein [Caudoviricetes sp.]
MPGGAPGPVGEAPTGYSLPVETRSRRGKTKGGNL